MHIRLCFQSNSYISPNVSQFFSIYFCLLGQQSWGFRYHSSKRHQFPLATSSSATTRYNTEHVSQQYSWPAGSNIGTVATTSYKVHKRWTISTVTRGAEEDAYNRAIAYDANITVYKWIVLRSEKAVSVAHLTISYGTICRCNVFAHGVDEDQFNALWLSLNWETVAQFADFTLVRNSSGPRSKIGLRPEGWSLNVVDE